VQAFAGFVPATGGSLPPPGPPLASLSRRVREMKKKANQHLVL
jgi:hypothetical protein